MPVRTKTYKLLQDNHKVLTSAHQAACADVILLQAENKQLDQVATDCQTQNNRISEELAILQHEFQQLKEQCIMVTQDWTETTAENELLRAQCTSIRDEVMNSAAVYAGFKHLYERRLQAAHDLITRADDIFRFIPASRQSNANRTQITQWRMDVIEAMKEEDNGGC